MPPPDLFNVYESWKCIVQVKVVILKKMQNQTMYPCHSTMPYAAELKAQHKGL